MAEILLSKPKMKLWLPLYYFRERGQRLLNKKQIDLETKQQGLASPMQLSLGLLWSSFAAPVALRHHTLQLQVSEITGGLCCSRSDRCFQGMKRRL